MDQPKIASSRYDAWAQRLDQTWTNGNHFHYHVPADQAAMMLPQSWYERLWYTLCRPLWRSTHCWLLVGRAIVGVQDLLFRLHTGQTPMDPETMPTSTQACHTCGELV